MSFSGIKTGVYQICIPVWAGLGWIDNHVLHSIPGSMTSFQAMFLEVLDEDVIEN